MTNLLKTTLVIIGAITALVSSASYADQNRRAGDTENLFLSIASALLVSEADSYASLDRPQHSRHSREHRPNVPLRDFPARNFHSDGYHSGSFTSEPVRGGSSRRTRIITNPYPSRPVTGVSFTGIEHDAVHINDVITYPRKRLISHRGYSLSLYHPSQFLNTRGYVDYISVKAKRKEYFTVTFHYD